MSGAVALVTAPPRSARLGAILALARIEARRTLWSPAIWIGLGLSAWSAVEVGGFDWQGGVYGAFMLGTGPLAAGIFVAGVTAGGRDRAREDRAVLAEEAALDASDRAAARLLGLVPVVLAGSLLVLAAAIAIRIEGGLWVGDAPGRTDEAVHGVAEVILPMLLLVFGACAGVAAGRTFRRRAPVILVGVVCWFFVVSAYWALQWAPAVYVVPTQVQPIEVAIEGAPTDPSALPADWLLTHWEDDEEWRRVLVFEPLTAWHDVYLIGLSALAVGIAVRSRTGRRLVVIGLLVAGAGVVGQALVMPDGASPVEIPQ